MSFHRWTSLIGRTCVVGSAVVLAAGLASAQSLTSQNQSSSAAFSSSGYSSSLQLAEASAPAGMAALPSAPSPGASAAGQMGQSSGRGGMHGLFHNRSWTFEAGGGFNGPIGNDTGTGGAPPVITWGGNFTLGAGLRFTKRFSTLFEYQFMDDKLPAQFLAEFAADGVTAGNSHINALTGSPVFDLTPNRSNGIYLVGGWGYYHKSTNLQTPELALSYYGEYYQNVTIASFTSNQWGGNGGFGIYHRIGGMYGPSHTMIFAEARYTFIHTPPATQNNGLGTTELIPVTFGVRF